MSIELIDKPALGEKAAVPPGAAVAVRGVTKAFGRGADGVVALDGIDLEVRRGEFLCVVGASGCGKSTLLNLIAGIDQANSGTVDVAGRTALMFQDSALFPWLTVRDNVALPMRLAGVGKAERRERAEELLASVHLAGQGKRRPHELSGGMRQRVALARALAALPPVLLLDEPLAALDSTTRREAIGELRAVFAETGTPVVIVTHSFEEAAALAGELIVIEAGREIQRGGAAEISASPASAFVADFSGAVVLRGEASAEGDLTVVRLPGGAAVWSADRARGPVALSVFPWEISIEADSEPARGGADSRLNRLACEVTTITTIGSRARIGLAAPEPLVAEITAASAARLDLRPGARVTAVWKATATRLIGDA
jgi:molybdopterin-binding protein